MTPAAPSPRPGGLASVLRWFDGWSGPVQSRPGDELRVDWPRIAPFIALHLACGFVFVVGTSAVAVVVAVVLFFVRLFAITGFYHRYFSHRAFAAGRVAQFVFAVLGNSAAQRGPLWWAAHHRHHHRHADGPEDLHSPRRRGFWWSHTGWFTAPSAFRTDVSLVPDLARFPELVFLDRFAALVPLLMFGALYAFGAWAGAARPSWGTSGPQMLVYGIVSTVVLFHVTYTINSLAHVFGSRPYATADDSRNNFWLALLTLGEGWHNNHHRYPASARNGFRAREIDVTYYVLLLLEKLRVIRDLKPVPEAVLAEARPESPRRAE